MTFTDYLLFWSAGAVVWASIATPLFLLVLWLKLRR